MNARAAATLLLGLLLGCGGGSDAGRTPRCGDGHVDRGEACDDGRSNGSAPDACREDCVLPACGDGIRDTGEDCDEGEGNSDLLPDACRTDCRFARCGDAVVDEGEACDDGERNGDLVPDACRSNCVLPACGDGTVDTGEACDEGPENSDVLPDRCRSDCGAPRCGDGVRDGGEGCDAGAANSDERPGACRTTCVVPRCGDGVSDAGEECDDGAENGDTTPDACRTACLLPRCGDGVLDPVAGETCEDGNDDPADGCHLCAWHVDHCEAWMPLPIDVTGGVPWDGEELVLEGTLVGSRDLSENVLCGFRDAPDRLHALPIPRAGDLFVRVTSTDGSFLPSVEIRRECDGGTDGGALACADAPAPGAPAVAVASVTPADAIRWFNVDVASGTPGPYEVRVRIAPPLPPGAACSPDGSLGSCHEGFVCDDPDGDGAGFCRKLVPLGGACDPAGLESLCAESVCRCPVDGCTVGTCVSTCGDGTVQPWEECEDDDVRAADNCTPDCRFAGRSCSTPYRLDLAAGPDGLYEWRGDTVLGTSGFTASCGDTFDIPELYASFTAPAAGTWAFRLVPLGAEGSPGPAWNAALSVVAGTCEAGQELACVASTASTSATPTLRVPLQAGETVWPIVDGSHEGSGGYDLVGGPFQLLAQRIVCGDGHAGLDEECDDGNLASGDNCLPDCTAAGASCASPWRLEWDAASDEAGWAGLLSRGGASFPTACGSGLAAEVARFVAPAAGTYAFELAGDDILSLRAGTCETSEELACRNHFHAPSRRVLVRDLAAGEEVWVVVDSRHVYRPDTGAFAVRVRPLVCGDGAWVLPEECDDGNVADADGCSATCTIEATETEPNDSRAAADALANGGIVAAALEPANERDWFRFDATAGVTYRVDISAGMVGNCTMPSSAARARLDAAVFDRLGNHLGWDALDDDAAGCLGREWIAPATGTYYLEVRPTSAATVPRYFVELR